MIRLINKNIFVIPGNKHMLHLATLGKGLREFWLMICISGMHKGKCYIEEYVSTSIDYKNDIFGNFKFIQSDEEAEELTRFAEEKGLTDIAMRANEMCESGLGHIVFGK